MLTTYTLGMFGALTTSVDEPCEASTKLLSHRADRLIASWRQMCDYEQRWRVSGLEAQLIAVRQRETAVRADHRTLSVEQLRRQPCHPI